MVVNSKKSLRISIAIQFDVVIREVFKKQNGNLNGTFQAGGGVSGSIKVFSIFFLLKNHLELFPDCKTRFAHSLSFILCIYSR